MSLKKHFKNFIFAGAFVFLTASPVMSVAIPQTVHASSPGNCDEKLLGVIPPWYRGLTNDTGTECVIKSPNDVGGLSNFIWRIVLNGIEMALVVASLIAVFFIIYGAFVFIAAGATAAQIEKGRKSIFSAAIGLVISIGAIGVTNLIFGVIQGASTANQYGVVELSAQDLLHNALNLAYYIAGIVAVIVIIIAGIMYASSMGNSGRVSRAKDMVLFAVIGLIILIAAFAITNFVLGAF